MAADDLTKPLGLLPPPKRPGGRFGLAFAIVAAVVVVGGVAAVWVTRTPGPTVTATIATKPNPSVSMERTAATLPVPPPVPSDAPGLIEVKPSGGLADVGRVIIHDPSEPTPISLPASPDDALIEKSSYGPLPKIASTGLRPLDAYARPITSNDGGAKIAIVLGGVGVDTTSTDQALNTLPGTVTLAFAPYGDGLKQLVTDARALGHELLLQIPLEPYGYPKTDPGPQTLTTTASSQENIDRLHWLMARMTNYVGVMNYMGARFTSETSPLEPVLGEIGKRGLVYVDDGSSPRSLAGDVARGRAPFVKADMVLDPDLTAVAIDARLAQLAQIARERGYAVATATAFPVTIDRIAAFAKNAASRDITLVPLSALVRAGGT